MLLAAVPAQSANLRSLSAKTLAAAGVPDPMCKTGVISLKTSKQPQSCCAGYCGECSDYPTCASVRGQDSANACCASKVLEMSCDNGAPANKCLKSCTESVPPCIMPKGEEFKMPEGETAAADCGNAVDDFVKEAENSVKEADGGEKQWTKMKENGVVLSQNRFMVNKQNRTKPCPPRVPGPSKNINL